MGTQFCHNYLSLLFILAHRYSRGLNPKELWQLESMGYVLAHPFTQQTLPSNVPVPDCDRCRPRKDENNTSPALAMPGRKTRALMPRAVDATPGQAQGTVAEEDLPRGAQCPCRSSPSGSHRMLALEQLGWGVTHQGHPIQFYRVSTASTKGALPITIGVNGVL